MGILYLKTQKPKQTIFFLDSNQEEAAEEERSKLLESQENEISIETLSNMEREITRRSGVDGFFHDRRVRQTSCICFIQIINNILKNYENSHREHTTTYDRNFME